MSTPHRTLSAAGPSPYRWVRLFTLTTARPSYSTARASPPPCERIQAEVTKRRPPDEADNETDVFSGFLVRSRLHRRIGARRVGRRLARWHRHPPLWHRQHRRLERHAQRRLLACRCRRRHLFRAGPDTRLGSVGGGEVGPGGRRGRRGLGGRIWLVLPAPLSRRPGGGDGDWGAGRHLSSRPGASALSVRPRRAGPATGPWRASRPDRLPRLPAAVASPGRADGGGSTDRGRGPPQAP